MLRFSDEASTRKLGLLSGMEGKTFKGISHESSNHCHFDTLLKVYIYRVIISKINLPRLEFNVKLFSSTLKIDLSKIFIK